MLVAKAWNGPHPKQKRDEGETHHVVVADLKITKKSFEKN